MLNGNGGGDAASPARRKGFLTRLARDVRGNTLAIVGAALVPLAGMIGSGVDMSRAYMAKTRLQSACDAAALAGRRVMTERHARTPPSPTRRPASSTSTSPRASTRPPTLHAGR